MKYFLFTFILSGCSFLANHPLVEDIIEEVVEDVVKIETGVDIKPELDEMLKKNPKG